MLGRRPRGSLVLSGGEWFKLHDAIVTVGPGDAIYCPSAVVREWEAGENGLEVIAYCGPVEGRREQVLERHPSRGLVSRVDEPTGEPKQKPLQTPPSRRSRKAVRGHWPLEGSNPSPSASAQKTLHQAVSELRA
jgi:hypothetical protein